MFNFKNIIAAVCVLATTCAFAQTPPPHAAGKGLAKNRENAAKFELRAGYGRNQELNADFNITVGGEDAPNRVHIELKRANELTFNRERHTATLTGTGVLAVKRGEQIERVEGRIQIIVADLAQPQREDAKIDEELSDKVPHDRIIVKFISANDNRTYSFEGLVVRGDIKIGAPIRN